MIQATRLPWARKHAKSVFELMDFAKEHQIIHCNRPEPDKQTRNSNVGWVPRLHHGAGEWIRPSPLGTPSMIPLGHFDQTTCTEDANGTTRIKPDAHYDHPDDPKFRHTAAMPQILRHPGQLTGQQETAPGVVPATEHTRLESAARGAYSTQHPCTAPVRRR